LDKNLGKNTEVFGQTFVQKTEVFGQKTENLGKTEVFGQKN
jgi:hypothetical protein